MTSRLRTVLALSFAALLASCGGGGGGSPEEQPAQAGLLQPAAPGALAAYFKDRIAQRLSQGLPATAALELLATPTQGSPGTVAGTLLQEPGVDEDDLLKTDGSFVYALHAAYGTGGSAVPARLAVSRIQPDGTLAAAGSATLSPEFSPTGMYHLPAAGRLAVVAQRNIYGEVLPASTALLPLPAQEIALDLFELSAGTPAQRHRIAIDGRLVATRMIGSVLYVASSWHPDLVAYDLPTGTTPAQARERLAGLSAEQLLPRIRIDGAAPQPLVRETDCLLQPANASLALQLTTVTAIDLASPGLERSSRCYVGDGSALYMSPTSVYLASSMQVWIAAPTLTIAPSPVTTDIHKFGLQGLAIDYRGSGAVAGHLGWDAEKMPARMSEHNGLLRVVSYTGDSASASPATLTVLREDAARRELAVVSTLPNARRPAPLGRAGEQVHGVRFAGPLAYVVTFRRTDPLYVLDLSDPADPRAAGELTVPGFSDDLFPLPNGKLLGVGKDATAEGMPQGVKLALFDVSDPQQPRLLESITMGGRFSASALDFSRHGISLYTEGATVRVALPVRLASTTVPGRLEQSLARFTVDTAAGSLVQRARVLSMVYTPGTSDDGLLLQYELGRDRAVQTAGTSYYLTGGRVIASHEP